MKKIFAWINKKLSYYRVTEKRDFTIKFKLAFPKVDGNVETTIMSTTLPATTQAEAIKKVKAFAKHKTRVVIVDTIDSTSLVNELREKFNQ